MRIIHVDAKNSVDMELLSGWARENGLDPDTIPVDRPLRVIEGAIGYYQLQRFDDEAPASIADWGKVVPVIHYCTPTPIPTLSGTLVIEEQL